MANKGKWTMAAQQKKETTAKALAALFEALNQGQQNKLLKNAQVRELLVFYGVVSQQ